MTTRSIVPNGDGEGSLGTASLKWGKVYSSDPASGENSGQVPTTAWVQTLVAQAVAAAQKQAKLDAHPVGSYYWSNDSTSPATLFGGTWEAVPAGRAIVSAGTATETIDGTTTTYTFEAEKTYGEFAHKLSAEETVPHSHVITMVTANGNPNPCVWTSNGGSDTGAMPQDKQKWVNHGGTLLQSGTTGGGKAHNNLSPCVAAYVWRRTA